jgi:hypothetical protein
MRNIEIMMKGKEEIPMPNNNEELYIVTEQGIFGELDVQDPSKRKANTKEELDKMIEEANKKNLGLSK